MPFSEWGHCPKDTVHIGQAGTEMLVDAWKCAAQRSLDASQGVDRPAGAIHATDAPSERPAVARGPYAVLSVPGVSDGRVLGGLGAAVLEFSTHLLSTGSSLFFTG
jgi:hypothetical protein